MAGWPCLTAFNNEANTACLYLSHLRWYTLVMIYTKAQTPLVQFVMIYTKAQTPLVQFVVGLFFKLVCKTCRQQIEPVEFERH